MLIDSKTTEKPLIDEKTFNLCKNVVLIFGLAFLTGLCSKISLEIGPVPITMQTIAVLLGAVFLKKEKAVLSQITYLLLGLFGIPWFSRGGGLSYVFNPSFGYIVGFILASFILGFLLEKEFDNNLFFVFFAFVLASFSVYLPGVLWLSIFVKNNLFLVGIYPFLLGDLLKSLVLALSYYLIKINQKHV